MGPKKGKKGKGSAKDDDWGDDSEKQVEEKLKNLLIKDSEVNDNNEDIPAAKSKGNKNKKKNKVKGEFYGWLTQVRNMGPAGKYIICTLGCKCTLFSWSYICYILEVVKPPSEDEDEMDNDVLVSDADSQENDADSQENAVDEVIEGNRLQELVCLWINVLLIKIHFTGHNILSPNCFKEVPKKPLTHKEKKELKKKQKMEAEIERITKKGGEGHSALGDNFTIAQALKTGGALTQLETAVDIKIDKFSIAAKGKDLFSNASLLIAQGRR